MAGNAKCQKSEGDKVGQGFPWRVTLTNQRPVCGYEATSGLKRGLQHVLVGLPNVLWAAQ